MTSKVARLLLVLFLASPLACATAKREAESPAADRPDMGFDEEAAPREPLTELDALQYDLDVAERQLDGQLWRKASYARQRRELEEEPQGRVPGQPSPYATPPPPAAGAEREGPRQQRWQAGSPCDLACRALASMQRSADGVCRLAGEGDTRCHSARDRVARARDRVTRAGCRCLFDVR